MTAPAVTGYMDYGRRLVADPGLHAHNREALNTAAHRLYCPGCLSVLLAGSDDDANHGVDAQLDVLIAAFDGNPRLALFHTTQALGFALLGPHRNRPTNGEPCA